MRRLEYLLTSVRRSTDTTNSTAITDAEMIEWFNDGQKLIQNLIIKNNPKADIFKTVVEYDVESDGEYAIPTDIYAKNAISLVEVKYSDSGANDGYVKIDRIDEGEAATKFGYYTINSVLVIKAENPDYSSVRLTYFHALARFDKRWATVQTVNSGVSLVVAAGYDSNASTVDEYISIVDRSGNVVRRGILIADFTGATWGTTDALTGVLAGHYVCMGKRSTTDCELPDECLPYLLDYVRKRLYGRNVYSDGGKQEIFTAEQKDELIRLFQNNTKENLIPPITDYDFLEF